MAAVCAFETFEACSRSTLSGHSRSQRWTSELLGIAISDEREGDENVISSVGADRVRRCRAPKWLCAPLALPASPARDARDA
jgi:hypothetical protein